MRVILILAILLALSACRTTKSNCDAYSQNDIKKDHQI